jgi:rod shape-determining protein MreC
MRLGFAISERKGLILVIILFINLLFISNTVIIDNRVSLFRHILGWMVSPLQIFFQEAADSVVYKYEKFIFQKNIFDRYQTLKRAHEQLKITHKHVVNTLSETQFWQKSPKSEHMFFLAVEMISIDPHFPYNEIRINSGTSDGIMVGMNVLNYDGDLVGQIVQPLDSFAATVRLITSPRGGVGAYISTNRLEGFISGDRDHAGLCTFKYILESLPVTVGDQVVSSGTDQIFASYLPIGEIVSMERDYLVQKIYLKPFFTQKPIKKLFVVSRE